MVGALHGMGLQVVLDEVFNHTAASGEDEKSVLDQVVPGYYQRLNAAGNVETSTCCQNVATEHEVAEKLMVDSLVMWAREYKVDGFRFDLMGHHSKANMLAIRAALDELTLKKDGVDGKAIYLYGEGWNFGEVANNALFEQATQGQLGGTGIGTFNDRLRDGVHGGSPVRESTYEQGFGTGLATDPNGHGADGTPEQQLARLGQLTDLVKIGLTGNLRDFELTAADGTVKAGDEIDYNGAPAGYADEPDETINYVDAHDNNTLYDLSVLKLPEDTTMAERVRMNTLELATVTLSQSPSFWHAGTELLRSKSLDDNSFNSGDWFNRIDWTGQESTFGSGLPTAADNADRWSILKPLLANPALKPQAADMATAEASALDLLRVRNEVDLLQLGSADLIEKKVSFPNSGTDAAPGVIVMLIDDLLGKDVDPKLEGALVVFNASPEATTQTVSSLAGRGFALTPALANGSDAARQDHDLGCRDRHGHGSRAVGGGARREGAGQDDHLGGAQQARGIGRDDHQDDRQGDRGGRRGPRRNGHRDRPRQGHRDPAARRGGEGQDRPRAADARPRHPPADGVVHGCTRLRGLPVGAAVAGRHPLSRANARGPRATTRRPGPSAVDQRLTLTSRSVVEPETSFATATSGSPVGDSAAGMNDSPSGPRSPLLSAKSRLFR